MDTSIKNSETNPQVYARICGVLYLIIIIAGIFAETFVRSQLVVPGNAVATSENILASEQLWRLGFAVSIVMLICDVGVSFILYLLLKPVSKKIALLSTFFRLVSISVLAMSLLNHFSALFPLDGSPYLKVFNNEQLGALSYLSIKTFSHGYNVSLVFFGFHCAFLGYLIFRSRFIPRVIGVLLVICSACYIINSFAWFVAPQFASLLFPAILIPSFVAEVSLCLWLIIKGLKPEWKMREGPDL